MFPHEFPESTGVRVTLPREALIPDPLRLARFRKAPEFGPRILFFTGSSAMNAVSRKLVEYTHNSLHVVTTIELRDRTTKLQRERIRGGKFDLPCHCTGGQVVRLVHPLEWKTVGSMT